MPFKPGPRHKNTNSKGETIFECTWEGCTKKFGTAGHVRRHEKTHVGSTPYPCPHCHKAFGRSDVRSKHVNTMHRDEDHDVGHDDRDELDGSSVDEPPRKIRKHSLDTSISNLAGLSTQPPPQRRASAASTLSSSYSDEPTSLAMPPFASPIIFSSHPCRSNIHIHPDTPPANILPAFHGDLLSSDSSRSSTASLSSSGNTITPLPSIMSTNSIPGTGYVDPANLNMIDPVITDELPMYSAQPLPDPSTDLLTFDPNWEWFGQLFGWGSDRDIDLDIGIQTSLLQKDTIGHGSSTDTLSAAWLLCSTPRATTPVSDMKPQDGSIETEGRREEGPWPNVFKPNVPDRPLKVKNVTFPRPNTGPGFVSQSSRNAMLSMIYLSHQPQWLMPEVDDFPDHDTLSHFVDNYFEHFHPIFPIIHRPTFVSEDIPAVLLLSVAAIGANFSGPEYSSLAVALCELARRMITWVRGSDQRAKFDHNLLLAFTLQTALGCSCGSREMFYHAEIFRCSIVTTCRRLHLLRGLDTATEELYMKGSNPSVEERYKAYLSDERRRRLGWGVYLLDAQMTALLSLPPIFTVTEARIVPPSEESLWNAPNANAWAAIIQRGEAVDPRISTRPKFSRLLTMCLAGDSISIKMSDFTLTLFTFTAWRMLFDQRLLQKALGVGMSENGMDMPSQPADCHIVDSQPGLLLTRLATASMSSRSPSHFRVIPSSVYHHAQMFFTRPGLLQRMKHVSGKYEPDMTQEGSLIWLKTWMADGKEVRKVLWHAGVLGALLVEFPRNSAADMFLTFDCALMFWVILKYAPHQLVSSTAESVFFEAKWFDIIPPDMWIAHGGSINFPFLGSSATWTIPAILRHFMERLSKMPWGLALQNKLVLEKLLVSELKEEDEKKGDV
ncbi:hypothetical protein, variant [Cryptococcus amylolentus CBS 6039]|uniref:C2H2-type domain-containing protein n=1 Tax=Cryptococcus amylolentus CBS 6039 TaxID=1295533 RepID=A0A1E3I1B9_9TREE|nr:hypothetical protein, variant [Cryptococcus amylolentus CBS 6039]ODN81756.1 hypothetical protein, variant [Cryptococcus amylolentus CBS 6039]